MVWSLNKWKCRAESWWDTTCDACVNIRKISYSIIKMLYVFALIYGIYVIFSSIFKHEVPWEIMGVKVLTPTVETGKEFKMVIDVNKNKNCHGFVTRSLGGACGNVDITTVPTTLGVGRVDFEVHLPVPDRVPDGAICIARIRIEYSCNAWQKLFPDTFTLPEVPFMVRKPNQVETND